MADTQSVATLIDSTTSKIQQLQQAFAELESHNTISLNLKWKELEAHFHGLEKSLKKRFNELEDQEKEYETKVSVTQNMLEKQEAIVMAKEQASLERLQEKRDAALSSIGYSFEKYKNHPSEPIVNVGSNGAPVAILEDKPDAKAAKFEIEEVRPTENGNTYANSQSELMKLCEEMDAKGLYKYISDNRKNLASIREEIAIALENVTDPFSLVLKSLKDFYSGEILGLDGKKDASLLGVRRTCLMLMESLGPLNRMLTSDIKEQAKEIANEWKPKLNELDIESCNGNSLEAHAFLQLLATFGIASESDQDETCTLIPFVSRRRQTADLCRLLGLSEKMPGVIEVLVNNGRQIEAINLAYSFELTEQFAPVPLLKAYLKEARKVSHIKAGNASPGAQNELNDRELSALKVSIKCIEEHKLEEQYPVDSLHKRIVQLEKVKADKRRAAEAAKPLSKRPRANGTTYAPRVTSVPEKSFYRTLDRYPYPYDRQFVYPAETHPQVLSPASYTISPTHSTYYGNGYPVQVQVQYQAPYIH